MNDDAHMAIYTLIAALILGIFLLFLAGCTTLQNGNGLIGNQSEAHGTIRVIPAGGKAYDVKVP